MSVAISACRCVHFKIKNNEYRYKDKEREILTEFAEKYGVTQAQFPSGAGKVKFQTAIKMEKDHRGIFPRMQFHHLDISKRKK